MPGELISSTPFTAQGNGSCRLSRSFEGFFASRAPGKEAAHNLPDMMDDIDHFLRQVWVPSASNLCFQIDGVPFQAGYKPEGNGVSLQIWAQLGYLPFSVESAQRRRMLISILEAARYLPRAKFGIDKENRIVVTQTVVAPSIQPPAFIFIPLTGFVQEAMPFIRLIGACL